MNDTTTSARAMVHTAAGCLMEAMTAEEAAWAAERSSWLEVEEESCLPAGWRYVEGGAA